MLIEQRGSLARALDARADSISAFNSSRHFLRSSRSVNRGSVSRTARASTRFDSNGPGLNCLFTLACLRFP